MWPTETPTRAAGLTCVLLAVVSAVPEITVYKKLGAEVVLKPGVDSVTSSIQWKHDGNLVADWDGAEIDLYRQYKVRGSLNTSNGEMTIRGLTRNESGLYTSEIDGIMSSKIHLILISPVPKPTVRELCNGERTICTLSCDADAADAAPVNYAWTPGNTAASRELRLTKEGPSNVQEFRCELRNPVSRERSDPAPNPFYTAPEGVGGGGEDREGGGGPNFSTGGVVLCGLLVAVLLLAAAHRCVAGMWFFQKSSMPWEPNFWRKHESPPGGSASNDAVAKDEETPLS